MGRDISFSLSFFNHAFNTRTLASRHSCSSIRSHGFFFLSLKLFSSPHAGQHPLLSVSPAASPGRHRLIVMLISRHRCYRCGACDLRSSGSRRINGVIRATSNRKRVFLNTPYNKAPIVIERTTRVCANNSSAGQREGEARGSRSEHRWSADVSVPGGGESTFPSVTCACVPARSACCGHAGSRPGPSSCRCSSPCPEIGGRQKGGLGGAGTPSHRHQQPEERRNYDIRRQMFDLYRL